MSKLTNYDAGYDEGAWEAFSEATGIGQQQEQKRRAAWWWFGGAGLLIVLGLVIFGSGKQEDGSGKMEERKEAGSRKMGERQEVGSGKWENGLVIPTKEGTQKIQEAQSTIASRFDEKNKWAKSSTPHEVEQKNFKLMQPKTTKITEPTREAKKQSITNKLQNGASNTGWQAADKLLPKADEPELIQENKEQLTTETPKPEEIVLSQPEPKIIDSIVPPMKGKKNKPAKSRATIFEIYTGMWPQALQMPVIENANTSYKQKGGYSSGISIGKEIGSGLFLSGGLGYTMAQTFWLMNKDTTITTYAVNSTFQHLGMDTASGRIRMKTDTIYRETINHISTSASSTVSSTWLCIPVQLQWNRSYKKLIYGATLGSNIYVLMRAKGFMPEQTNNIVQVSKSNLTYSSIIYATAGIKVGYAMTDNLGLMVTPTVCYTSTNSRTNRYGYQFSIGLQYTLNKKTAIK